MADYKEAFVGIDVAKLKNAIAIAEAGREAEVRFSAGLRYRRPLGSGAVGYRITKPAISTSTDAALPEVVFDATAGAGPNTAGTNGVGVSVPTCRRLNLR